MVSRVATDSAGENIYACAARTKLDQILYVWLRGSFIAFYFSALKPIFVTLKKTKYGRSQKLSKRYSYLWNE